MIKTSYLYKIYKAGDIASQLDQLYDQQIKGVKTKIIVGKGQVPIEEAIHIQETRIKEMLTEIHKGYKSSGVEN